MVSVIIVAAGSGSRMNLGYNKALYDLNEQPLYLHSINKFRPFVDEIILVVNKNDNIKPILGVKIVYGGATRFQSVYQGLLKAQFDHVLIHDAARPFVSETIIKNCLKALTTYQALVVAVAVKDTVKKFTNNKLTTLDRNQLLLAQTPQGGNRNLLLDVFKLALNENIQVSDDIAVIEAYSDVEIAIIDGSYQNIKLTTKDDLAYAKFLIAGGFYEH